MPSLVWVKQNIVLLLDDLFIVLMTVVLMWLILAEYLCINEGDL